MAFDIKDATRVLKEDNLYNSDTRKKLMNYINDYKNDPNFKSIFDKKAAVNADNTPKPKKTSCKSK